MLNALNKCPELHQSFLVILVGNCLFLCCKTKTHELGRMKLVKKVVSLQKGILFLALIQGVISLAQEHARSIVKESFSLTVDCRGSAEYGYIIDQGKRVYDGEFYFNSSEVSSLDVSVVHTTELFGAFSKGEKSGPWKFSKSELSAAGKPVGQTHTAYLVNYPAAGKQRLVSGDFLNGKAVGKWTSGIYTLNQGRVTDTLSFCKTQLKENRWLGTFSGYSGQFEITGNVDDDGFADGIWMVLHNNGTLKEERRYKSGELVEHNITKDGVRFNIPHLGMSDSEGHTMEVEISSVYLDVLYQTSVLPVKSGNKILKLQDVRKMIGKGNTFIEESLFRFLQNENMSIWEVLPGSSSFQLPKLKIRKYPFSEQEKIDLEHISELLADSKDLVEVFFSDPHVDLSIHREEELAYRHEVFSEYSSALNKLTKLVDLLERPSFEFVDRKLLLPYLAEDFLFPSVITYSFGGKKNLRETYFPKGLEAESFSIASINGLIESIHFQLIKESNEVRPILAELKRESEVSDKEKVLLELRDSLRGQFANTLGLDNFNQYHEQYSDQVLSFVNHRFSVYAQLELDDRIATIDEELVCFLQFIEFYEFLANLTSKLNDVEMLYTRKIWNPFTFTDMQEIVKERVFNAYEKTLLPYAFQELEQGLSCYTINKKMNQFSYIFSKMKELRERDTSELESQLKRFSTLEEVAKVFELNLGAR